MIQVTVDGKHLEQQLLRVEQALRVSWWRRWAPTAESLIEREQRRHFAGQSSPAGRKWAPHSPLTLELSRGQAALKVGRNARSGTFKLTKNGRLVVRGSGGAQRTATVRRTGGSRLLQDTRRLEASVSSKAGTGAIREIGVAHLIVGTRTSYAKIHQFGGVIQVTPKMRGYLSATLGRWFGGKKITIPARPFLGTGPQSRRELAVSAKNTMNRVLREAAK